MARGIYVQHHSVLDLLRDGRVDGRAIISHTFPLQQMAEAMLFARDHRSEVLKVVITM